MKTKPCVWLTCLLSLIIVIVVFAGACGPAQPSGEKPIKIGVLLPMTGGAAHWGPQAKGGIEVRLDEVGRQVVGRPIEVFYEDDGSFDEVMALRKARKLVEVDGVNFLFGPIASSSFLGTETYIDVKQIPTFAIGYRGELREWTEPSWDFASNGGLAQMTYQAGTWAYQHGFRTATTMGADYETGYQGVGAFAEAFTKAGGKIVQQQWAPVGTADWGPYMASLEKADCGAVIQYGPDMLSYVTQWHEFGFWDKQPLIILDTTTVYDSTLAELGDWTEGLIAATDYNWTIDNPINNKFVPAFEAKMDIKPETMGNYGYAAASFVLAIMEATKGDTNPEKVREALVANGGMSIDVPAGKLKFLAEKGYSIKDTFIAIVEKTASGPHFKVVQSYPQIANPGYYTKPE